MTTYPMDASQIIPAIQARCAADPDLAFGPGHVVLSDYNLGDGMIAWCLEECDRPAAYPSATAATIAQTRALLHWLQGISEEARCAAMTAYWAAEDWPS